MELNFVDLKCTLNFPEWTCKWSGINFEHFQPCLHSDIQRKLTLDNCVERYSFQFTLARYNCVTSCIYKPMHQASFITCWHVCPIRGFHCALSCFSKPWYTLYGIPKKLKTLSPKIKAGFIFNSQSAVSSNRSSFIVVEAGVYFHNNTFWFAENTF